VTVEVNHVVEGDGPAARPAQLAGTSLGMWDDQAGPLSERLRLIRYDQRGHGDSPGARRAPTRSPTSGGDLIALLDRLEIERVSLCGLSLGGMTAMWVASEIPDRIERLVLCCTSALLGPASDWQQRARTVRGLGVQAIADAVLRAGSRPGSSSGGRRRSDRLDAMLRATPAEGYAGCCEAIRDMDLSDRLARISGADARDRRRRRPGHAAAARQAIANAVPGARLEIVGRRPPGQRGAAGGDHGKDPGSCPVTRACESGARSRRRARRPRDRGTTDFTRRLPGAHHRYAWGEIWTRPGLDRRTRSAITITALVALNHHNELAMHSRAALRNGLTPDEIKEVLLQAAIYCGVPAANSAFAIAQQVLDEHRCVTASHSSFRRPADSCG
jgi:3-oxoadipate enol-lactonase/4-carboxymuconolactone decarboxylase